jgi:hypothetical protein
MKTQTLLRIRIPVGTATWYTFPMSEILFKMCRMVGSNFYKMNFSETNWFMKYSWTKEQEEKFQIWMTEFLKRKDVMGHFMLNNRTTKKERGKVVHNFTWHHGWKTYSGS